MNNGRRRDFIVNLSSPSDTDGDFSLTRTFKHDFIPKTLVMPTKTLTSYDITLSIGKLGEASIDGGVATVPVLDAAPYSKGSPIAIEAKRRQGSAATKFGCALLGSAA